MVAAVHTAAATPISITMIVSPLQIEETTSLPPKKKKHNFCVLFNTDLIKQVC